MNLFPLKQLKSIPRKVSKLFSDYLQSHFKDIDIKTRVGQRRLVLKSFFNQFNKFR